MLIGAIGKDIPRFPLVFISLKEQMEKEKLENFLNEYSRKFRKLITKSQGCKSSNAESKCLEEKRGVFIGELADLCAKNMKKSTKNKLSTCQNAIGDLTVSALEETSKCTEDEIKKKKCLSRSLSLLENFRVNNINYTDQGETILAAHSFNQEAKENSGKKPVRLVQVQPDRGKPTPKPVTTKISYKSQKLPRAHSMPPAVYSPSFSGSSSTLSKKPTGPQVTLNYFEGATLIPPTLVRYISGTQSSGRYKLSFPADRILPLRTDTQPFLRIVGNKVAARFVSNNSVANGVTASSSSPSGGSPTFVKTKATPINSSISVNKALQRWELVQLFTGNSNLGCGDFSQQLNAAGIRCGSYGRQRNPAVELLKSGPDWVAKVMKRGIDWSADT